MLLGGGFLKQGADTAKYNRSLLGKEPHKPFERKPDRIREKISFREDMSMSEEIQNAIREQSYIDARAEIRKKLFAAAAVGVLLVLGLVIMFW